jgi:hypothetical protein
MTMRRKQVSTTPTQHALLVVWGEYAQTRSLVEKMMAILVHQKERVHTPQRKVLELLVATLAGLPYLEDISCSAHPIDQDTAVAEAWGQTGWADYSGVSRTLQALTMDEAQQFIQCLQRVSQPFIDAEVERAMAEEGRVVYDGDLTGLPVSKSSTTYPEVAYGHMDDAIRLGYQAAVVSLRSLSYGRLWLAVEHHPGNTLSTHQALALVQAAEASTGRCPWRRIDLLEQRLELMNAAVNALQKRLAEHQLRLEAVQAQRDQTLKQAQALQCELAEWEGWYQARSYSERPTSRLAKLRQRVLVFQKRCARRENGIRKAIHLCEWSQERLSRQQAEQRLLQERLESFRQENATNHNQLRGAFRLDAGFGTWENLALLIEMGYEVYTKVNNHMNIKVLHKSLADPSAWQTVGVGAQMQASKNHCPDGFWYPIDVGLERFQTSEGGWKLAALLHFGPDPVATDCQRWFDFYNGRQIIEAGIKEGKHVFYLHHFKVRSIPAIRLQEYFIVFASNFIRWASAWIDQNCTGSAKADLQQPKVGTKRLVHVMAHTSAEVSRSSDICLLRFGRLSCLAGKDLCIPRLSSQPLIRAEKVQFFLGFQRFAEWLHNS